MKECLNDGYLQKNFGQQTKRYCQKLELSTDPKLIEWYREVHRPENSWREISAGIREIGILEMEIYIFDNMLFMVVDTVADFEWDSAFKRLATMDRQQEWESHVSQFQMSDIDATSAEKWTLIERIFKLLPQ